VISRRTQFWLVACTLITSMLLVPTVASADSTFSVMNASGGIYWRSAPDWNTAEAVSGNGFYPNTVISVSCYQSGAANVPGSTDSMWEQASWVSGQGGGHGWINEHFINDGSALNQPSPGIGPCTTSPPPPPPPPAVGQTILNAAVSQSGEPYCFDGGTPSGPSHGSAYSKQVAEGAVNCLNDSTVGYDCTGLTLYAVYLATGIVLSHSGSQATDAEANGGQFISAVANLEPGDLVFFGGTFGNFLHSGIYAGGGQIWDANVSYTVTGVGVRPDGVHEEPLSWQYAFVGAVRMGSSSTTTTTVPSGTTTTTVPSGTTTTTVPSGTTTTLTLAKPGVVSVYFANGKSILSSTTKNELAHLARKLDAGDSVTITGYAKGRLTLARSRAKVVADYLSRIVKVRSVLKAVTSSTTNKTTIKTTKV